MEANKQPEDEKETGRPVRLLPSYYQLTTEDYENIWLRIKYRGSKWFWSWTIIGLAVFSAIFSSGVYGLYSYGKQIMDEKISAYLKTPEFKNEVKMTFQNQFSIMNDKLKLIDEGLAKLAIYEAAPYKVTDYGFMLVDSKGTHVTVEYGSGVTGHTIKFRSHFNKPPMVIATSIGSPIWTRKYPVSVTEITPTAFVAMAAQANDIISTDINWIAIGR